MSSAVDIASPARDPRQEGRAPALLVDLYLSVRLSVAGFSAMLPILGAISTGVPPAPLTLVGLVAVAMLFHVYAYLLNDVIDLDVDRREPQIGAEAENGLESPNAQGWTGSQHGSEDCSQGRVGNKDSNDVGRLRHRPPRMSLTIR